MGQAAAAPLNLRANQLHLSGPRGGRPRLPPRHTAWGHGAGRGQRGPGHRSQPRGRRAAACTPLPLRTGQTWPGGGVSTGPQPGCEQVCRAGLTSGLTWPAVRAWGCAGRALPSRPGHLGAWPFPGREGTAGATVIPLVPLLEHQSHPASPCLRLRQDMGRAPGPGGPDPLRGLRQAACTGSRVPTSALCLKQC